MSSNDDNMKDAVNLDKQKTGRATFKKLVVPFDLDSIFSMQYSTQGLKAVLEFIFEHMGDWDDKFNGFQTDLDRLKDETSEVKYIANDLQE